MKTTEVTLRFLIAEDGYLLRNIADKTIISSKVALASNDSESCWEEVLEDVAISEKEQLEKEIEENLNALVNNTNTQ